MVIVQEKGMFEFFFVFVRESRALTTMLHVLWCMAERQMSIPQNETRSKPKSSSLSYALACRTQKGSLDVEHGLNMAVVFMWYLLLSWYPVLWLQQLCRKSRGAILASGGVFDFGFSLVCWRIFWKEYVELVCFVHLSILVCRPANSTYAWSKERARRTDCWRLITWTSTPLGTSLLRQ